MAEDYEARTTAFLKWFRDTPGTTFHGDIAIVDLRGRGAGRGITAKKDLQPGTVIFTVPRTAIIGKDTSDLQVALPHLFKLDDDTDETESASEDSSWIHLILIVMYELMQGEKSRWKPYLDILPDVFNTPMFWSPDELKHLQASSVIAKIGRDGAEDMFRKQIIPVIQNFQDIFVPAGAVLPREDQLIEMAHKAGSAIMAYAFNLDSEDEENEAEDEEWVEDASLGLLMGMVPMADILNSDAEFNAHVNHGEDALTVTSLRLIPAGEEILNYYGPYSNGELLRRYGYVTPKHSRYDVVEIPWSLLLKSTQESLGISAEKLLELAPDFSSRDDFEDSFVLERESGEPDSEGRLPTAARMAELPEDMVIQVKSFLSKLKKSDSAVIPGKRTRDELLLQIANNAFRLRLGEYSTTAEDDQRALEEPGLPSRVRMAVEVRLGEKRLLEEALLLTGQLQSVQDGNGLEEEPVRKRQKASE